MKHYVFLLLFQFTSSSIYFKIPHEPGTHLWSMPANEKANPKYKRFNLPKNSNTGISYPSSSSSNISDSSSEEQSTLQLETCNTYIILKITRHNKFYLFYWVGAHSSEAKRRNVANSVGFILKDQILKEMNEENLKIFHREAEGAENEIFCMQFQLLRSAKKPRLYRIAGSTGQFTMQILPKYSEMNGSDSFVLEKYGEVFNWNSIHSNEYKISQAKTLGERISQQKTDKQGYTSHFYSITEGDTNISKNLYNTVRRIFLKNMADVPESRAFPRTPLDYTDEDLAEERRIKLNLFEYFKTSMKYVFERRLVPWRILRFDIFSENNAYLLVDYICGNIIVFLGKKADTEQVKQSLREAEEFSKTVGVDDAWQRVKVLRLDQKLTIQFQIYFECDT